MLGDHPVWDAPPVTIERMVGLVLGQEGTELLEDGFDDVRWHCGHGAPSFRLGSVKNSPDDGASGLALYIQKLSLLTEALSLMRPNPVSVLSVIAQHLL